MRLALAGLGFLALAAAPAQAADLRLPVKAPPSTVIAFYNWTGFYVGGHVGYAWADFDSAGPLAGIALAKADGFMYGATLGFNWQAGSWVFGVEGELSWGDIKWNQNVAGIGTGSVKLDHIYTAAGRIGYAFDRTLIYGKIGGAWTEETYNFALLGGTATGTASRSGYLLGIGLEYAFWGGWSGKIEYNYMDLGSKNVALGTTGGLVVLPVNVDLTVQTIKLGLNYKFNWGRF
jgi:outer membrane immunogenic protein